MATVVFSTAQRRFTRGESSVDVDATRVDALIEFLTERYPELGGSLAQAAVSIDGVLHNDARYVSIPSDAEVQFVGAIGGGSGDAVSSDPARECRDPLTLARDWKRSGRGVALATVVETWGSSPCPAGSVLVADSEGRFEGSVSGGCVESAVIEKAREVIFEGVPVVLEFGVADEEAWAVGLACGGRVRISVEPLD